MIIDESKPIRAAIYCRVSTDEQAERGFSLEGQLKKLRNHCENKEWPIAGEYMDPGFTGRNTRRPGYQQMLSEIDKWDGILVLKMDRIHRNSKNFMAMMDEIRKYGKDFISFSENFDTSTSMGRFVMDIIQRIAQLESEQIGERVAFALVEKAKKNEKFMGHRLPFGYKLKNHKITPVLEDLEIVKLAFDLYVNGTVQDPVIKTDKGFINQITGHTIKNEGLANRVRNRYLNNGHSFTSIGQELDISAVNIRYYLNNLFYVGYERWCHYCRKINDGFEPLITPKIWNKTQHKMMANCRTHKYDPILIPDDMPESFQIDVEKRKVTKNIQRAKHNYVF